MYMIKQSGASAGSYRLWQPPSFTVLHLGADRQWQDAWTCYTKTMHAFPCLFLGGSYLKLMHQDENIDLVTEARDAGHDIQELLWG